MSSFLSVPQSDPDNNFAVITTLPCSNNRVNFIFVHYIGSLSELEYAEKGTVRKGPDKEEMVLPWVVWLEIV